MSNRDVRTFQPVKGRWLAAQRSESLLENEMQAIEHSLSNRHSNRGGSQEG